MRYISTRHASTPSPARRRWREAPDEGSMPCSSLYAHRTLTPTPLPMGEGLQPLRYSANQNIPCSHAFCGHTNHCRRTLLIRNPLPQP
ncbi:MAG: hypothetical protein CVV12_05480 [Gammaproteobacteria bacterium HGW-Gammaproteobacteria-2]|nr:MAG: hypothetical protein CVV12_05480 [Gammaproteobacteria bacterium HGW-Gammaproteobacteria-2]